MSTSFPDDGHLASKKTFAYHRVMHPIVVLVISSLRVGFMSHLTFT